MQVLCDLQPLFSLFKCQTPGPQTIQVIYAKIVERIEFLQVNLNILLHIFYVKKIYWDNLKFTNNSLDIY